MQTKHPLISLLLVSTLITACHHKDNDDKQSSSGNETDNTASATFVDNAVSGLQYLCSSSNQKKVTDDQGMLECNKNDTVTFYVGSIELGMTVITDSTVFITPATLIGQNTDENTAGVLNMGRFLISLDSDQDVSNGISIATDSLIDTSVNVDFNQSVEDFANSIDTVLTELTQNLENGPFPLVKEDDAHDHLRVGLYLRNAGVYEGLVNYGDADRKVTLLVSRRGHVQGTNKTLAGKYAHSGLNEQQNLSSLGSTDFLRVDGSTGATKVLNAHFSDGVLTGSSAQENDQSNIILLEAKRIVAFDSVYDQAVVDRFNGYMPIDIDLGQIGQFRFFNNSEDLQGIPYIAMVNGAPSSSDPEKDISTPHWIYIFGEIVSAKNNQIRLVALSLNGYFVDMTFDLSGQEPSMIANWSHVYEGKKGISTSFQTNNWNTR
ncbi:hypothetical protein [Hahella sp. CCB-MM4]|uniref:hypothetical protein n=1 Tax=Hahella sp. (strain CCB-MM4) TaxID=1926491 RepID=UPI00113FD640|nr:hypothetical protein [Hahella sp. CCB-MM4]